MIERPPFLPMHMAPLDGAQVRLMVADEDIWAAQFHRGQWIAADSDIRPEGPIVLTGPIGWFPLPEHSSKEKEKS